MLRPSLWVRMPVEGEEHKGCFFLDGELTPDEPGWTPLFTAERVGELLNEAVRVG